MHSLVDQMEDNFSDETLLPLGAIRIFFWFAIFKFKYHFMKVYKKITLQWRCKRELQRLYTDKRTFSTQEQPQRSVLLFCTAYT